MSDRSAARFEVPGKLNEFMAVVVAHSRENGETGLAEALETSTYTVEEAVEYDEWDGGADGHAVHILIPPDSFRFLDIDNLRGVEDLVKARLNNLIGAENEYIAEVTIGMGETSAVAPTRLVSPREAYADRWGDTEFLRLFITHKSEDKERVAQIRDACRLVGVSCFVAHEDIEPTTEWQTEIERALQSMDALLALLTADFHDSDWTDQEVGAAIGRQVPVMPVRSGCDPYGFIGKYQAIQGHEVTASVLAGQVVAACLDRFTSTKARMKVALVSRFEQAEGWDHTRRLMGLLESIDALPAELVDRLEAAPADNSEIADTFDIESRLGRLLTRFRQPNDQ